MAEDGGLPSPASVIPPDAAVREAEVMLSVLSLDAKNMLSLDASMSPIEDLPESHELHEAQENLSALRSKLSESALLSAMLQLLLTTVYLLATGRPQAHGSAVPLPLQQTDSSML